MGHIRPLDTSAVTSGRGQRAGYGKRRVNLVYDLGKAPLDTAELCLCAGLDAALYPYGYCSGTRVACQKGRVRIRAHYLFRTLGSQRALVSGILRSPFARVGAFGYRGTLGNDLLARVSFLGTITDRVLAPYAIPALGYVCCDAERGDRVAYRVGYLGKHPLEELWHFLRIRALAKREL